VASIRNEIFVKKFLGNEKQGNENWEMKNNEYHSKPIKLSTSYQRGMKIYSKSF